MKPEKFYFKDDGNIPNSKFPLLLYRDIFDFRDEEGADWLEKKFAEYNWTNSWRNGIFNYHHYHSITHEVLGVYSGKALLHLGGEKGERLEVMAGDVIIIPAGVGHKNLQSKNFKVVGAYPNGSDYDIKTGKEGERPEADKNITAVPIPRKDPVLGKEGGVPQIWSRV